MNTGSTKTADTVSAPASRRCCYDTCLTGELLLNGDTHSFCGDGDDGGSEHTLDLNFQQQAATRTVSAVTTLMTSC